MNAGAPDPQQGQQPQGPQQQDKDDDRPDPGPPWTEFRVAAAKAEKAAALYTEHKATLEPSFAKIAKAAERYEEKWITSRKAWDDLLCRLERIGKVLTQAIGKEAQEALDACWAAESPTAPTTPAACAAIDAVECSECDEHHDLTELPSYQQLARQAEECAATRGTAFTTLAELPEGLADQIAALDKRAGEIDDGMSAAGHDPRRSYVGFLQLRGDEKTLTTMLDRKAENPSADYACRLKKRFDELLRAHRTWICVALAVHELETRGTIEQEAQAARAENLVEIVLACAAKRPATTPGTYCGTGTATTAR